MNTTRILATLAILSCGATAASINIAFHNGGVTIAAMTTQPDGSVVATSVDTWNNPAKNNGVGLAFTGFALSDASGSATTATLDATSGYANFNSNGWGAGTQDAVMMEGWYGFRDAESLTVNNLPAEFTSLGYTITIYGDSNVVTPPRTMDYFINGEQRTNIDSANFSGTFSEGVNFVSFGDQTGSSFTITGNVASGGRSAINGIVISTIPEPGSLLLFSLASFSLLGRRRR